MTDTKPVAEDSPPQAPGAPQPSPSSTTEPRARLLAAGIGAEVLYQAPGYRASPPPQYLTSPGSTPPPEPGPSKS